MASIKETLAVHHSKKVVISALKSISPKYKNMTLSGIDLYDLRCRYTFIDAFRAYPVTISVRVLSIQDNKSRLEIESHTFGANRYECITKLSEFKSLLSNELSRYKQPPQTSIADEILKYKNLLDIGAISEEEYNSKKDELLNKK